MDDPKNPPDAKTPVRIAAQLAGRNPEEEHLIVYASPAHDDPYVVECSCGWKTSSALTEIHARKATMDQLLSRWLEHALAATQAEG